MREGVFNGNRAVPDSITWNIGFDHFYRGKVVFCDDKLMEKHIKHSVKTEPEISSIFCSVTDRSDLEKMECEN